MKNIALVSFLKFYNNPATEKSMFKKHLTVDSYDDQQGSTLL